LAWKEIIHTRTIQKAPFEEVPISSRQQALSQRVSQPPKKLSATSSQKTKAKRRRIMRKKKTRKMLRRPRATKTQTEQ